MQIKTIMRFHFIPTRIAIISIGEDAEKLELLYIADGHVNTGSYPSAMFKGLKTIWQFLKMLNTELPYDLAIPQVGIYM